MVDRENWWEGPGNYTGASCKHCGRERVCNVEAPDGTDRAVCEKCGWDQVSDDYAGLLLFPNPSPIGED